MSEEEEKKEWREKFSRWWDELVTEQGMRPTKVNEIPEVVAYYNQATQKNLKKQLENWRNWLEVMLMNLLMKNGLK
jgi:rhamnogalacturonyl hydrolase YesR